MRTLEELRHVRMSEMTKDERMLVLRAAGAKLQRELEANRPAIERILNTPLDDAGGAS